MGDAINHQIFDYYQVNDLASNQIILLNILYARDGEPLHFSELSQIRGQLSASANASTTFPYGAINHASMTTRNLATLGGAVSTSPSFDIVSLDTKDFTAGVMTPIAPDAVRFFLNEGIDYRMVLLLLVSGIRPAGSPEMILNAPDDSRTVCVETPHEFGSNAELSSYRIVPADASCANKFSEFFAFLDIVNHVNRFYPVLVPQPARPVGPPFTLSMNSNLRAVAGIDPQKYSLQRLRSGEYQLMTVPRSSTVVLCEATGGSPRVVSALSNAEDGSIRVRADACSGTPNAADDETTGASRPAAMVTIGVTPGTFALELRSTLEVIRYIGQILAFQDAETATHPQFPERCVTLQFIPYDARHATCNGAVLIHLVNATAGLPPSDVNVFYNGQRWSLAASRTCSDRAHCDLSSQTMSIISLLLNRNKSAQEIPKTPAVEVVP